MNSFLVYLILQLDAIGAGMIWITIFTTLLSIIFGIITIIVNVEYCDNRTSLAKHPDSETYKRLDTDYKKLVNKCLGRLKKMVALSIFMILLTMFIPSTKTAAIVYVLPKVVNSKIVKEELSDLYKIAKKGLVDITGYEEESNEE